MRQTYSSYVNPDIDWLSKTPSHWGCIPLGRIYRRVKQTKCSEEQLLSVYRDYGVIPKESRSDNFNKASDDLNAYQLVQIGNLVLNKMKAWQGSIAISEFRGIVSPAYFVYRPLAQVSVETAPKFIHFLLRSVDYIAQYLRHSKGIRVNQWDLDPDALERIEILLPPLAEQTQIAKFLDYETAKIDALIAKQQQLIALLKEKRQAVISHAVTKGLNPDAPMRDSGVEWLGEVPAHWDIKRLKHLCDQIIAGPFGSSLTKDMFSKSGYRIYGQEQVIANDFSLGDYYISNLHYTALSRYRVYENDLLISCVGTFGKIAVVPPDAEKGIINPRLIKVKPANTVNSHFLSETLKSNVVSQQFEQLSRGGTMGVINIGILSEIVIAVPSINEQNQIFQHIALTGRFYDQLCDKSEESIHLLQERRTALISAAVTGKIDVRDWQPPADFSVVTEEARA